VRIANIARVISMKIDIATRIALPPEHVWAAVQRHELLRHIAAPLIRFSPAQDNDWPSQFTDGQPVAAPLWLLGIIPLGIQWIVPSLHPPEQGDWPQRLRDNGHSRLIRRWDHWISVEPDGAGGTVYRDSVDVEGGLLTPLIAMFAHLFYRHRQRRWRSLAGTLGRRQLIWDAMREFEAAKAAGGTEAAWRVLERIHIIAQPHWSMHLTSHVTMLRFAITQQNGAEIVGQILRLALAPLGNLTGRLPIGNTGRAHVSAFDPMNIPDDLREQLRSLR
jgi:ligand-binding SRPBCC domain-containing protein